MDVLQGIIDWIITVWNWMISSGFIILLLIVIGFFLFFIIVKKIGTRHKAEKPTIDKSDRDIEKIVNDIVEPIVDSFHQKEKKDNDIY
jgi:flagellar biosynthesis/type III secretory pathway M-ring protein FliF/YscJ